MSEVAGGSLPRSDSSVAMEASAPSSSTSSPPSSPSDGPRRLTVTQLEQLRVEEEVFEIYRILRGIAPHTQSFMYRAVPSIPVFYRTGTYGAVRYDIANLALALTA
ncbi:hypothetical protein B296_00011363 [Ensete ventricosum]|uniref:Uncharacterized protein n=1 Tax=Ensete ventricosum TaxID=4639 RepID=A0A427B3F1_ENSVE|nr:hypothetical protein B296_00011363 [Ensete ventricosum]